jgi:hypothetical protein
MIDAAPWLKTMENGGLGEARAKAFLMDRFWVLERSVDVEGADYLVQRRLTAQNFMDRDPPRLGVVQVKFIQDGGTSISIHKSYVCDDKGHPYNEFFLLVFTGREDHEKAYLLSARDIVDTFSQVSDGRVTRLRLGGNKLIANSNFEVTKKRAALDRIEHALCNSDFLANRRFLGSTGYVKISRDHIDEDYLKPLDNCYADIQEQFFKSKKQLQSALFDVQDVAEAMQKILRSTDPIEAAKIFEDDIAQYIDGYGRLALGSGRDFGFDEDFVDAVKNHKARLEKLRVLGLTGNYFKVLDDLEAAFIKCIADEAFDAEAIKVVVVYDEDTLGDCDIRVSAAAQGTQTKVKRSQKGRHVASFNLKTELPNFSKTEPKDRAELIRKQMWQLRRPIHGEIDRLYLGEDLVAF